LTNKIDVFIINGPFLFRDFIQYTPLLKLELGLPLFLKQFFYIFVVNYKL